MAKQELNWLASINDEHATLMSLARRAGEVISHPAESLDLPALVHLLEELLDHCSRHMALEEANGYLEPVRKRLPIPQCRRRRRLPSLWPYYFSLFAFGVLNGAQQRYIAAGREIPLTIQSHGPFTRHAVRVDQEQGSLPR